MKTGTLILKDTESGYEVKRITTNHHMSIDDAMSGFNLDENGQLINEETGEEIDAYYDNLVLVWDEVFILIDDCGTDIYTSEYPTFEDAIEAGSNQFDKLTESDKKRRKEFYIIRSVNTNPDSENHLDGDIIKRWI